MNSLLWTQLQPAKHSKLPLAAPSSNCFPKTQNISPFTAKYFPCFTNISPSVPIPCLAANSKPHFAFDFSESEGTSSQPVSRPITECFRITLCPQPTSFTHLSAFAGLHFSF